MTPRMNVVHSAWICRLLNHTRDTSTILVVIKDRFSEESLIRGTRGKFVVISWERGASSWKTHDSMNFISSEISLRVENEDILISIASTWRIESTWACESIGWKVTISSLFFILWFIFHLLLLFVHFFLSQENLICIDSGDVRVERLEWCFFLLHLIIDKPMRFHFNCDGSIRLARGKSMFCCWEFHHVHC